MKKLSKGGAFIFGMISILSVFLIVVVVSIFDLTNTNELMIAAFLTAIVGMVTSYMGIDVVNNGVRGKCYRQEVADLDAKQRGE
jgi:hypothetical protein